MNNALVSEPDKDAREQNFLRNPRRKISVPGRERGGKSVGKGNEWKVMQVEDLPPFNN